MTEPPDPRDLERVGMVLDEKWTLEKLLGSGGMGAVYAARHRNGARSAVKVLHPDLARVPDVRERFLREGYAANKVDHRGVVKVLDDDTVKAGPLAGLVFLVMELLEGESLDERSKRRPPLNERELLEVVDAVLEVLEVAHGNGVIHRDIKPENLFLARDEDGRIRVKVLDFGLARVADAAQITNSGRAIGTPSFMSPEQAAGSPDAIDQRTDIFALGSTLFQLISGRRIHEADNIVHLVLKMASLPAPPLKEVMPSVSEGFAKVVDRALAYEKDNRYPDARSMRDDLQAALDALPPTPSSLGMVRTVTGPPPPLESTKEVSTSELHEIVANDRAIDDGPRSKKPSSRRIPTAEEIRETAVPPARREREEALAHAETAIEIPPSIAPKPQGRGCGSVIVVMIVAALAGAGGFLMWPDLKAKLFGETVGTPRADVDAAPAATTSTTAVDASVSAPVTDAGADAAFTPVLIELSDFDASAFDASVDGGEDEDEDEDDAGLTPLPDGGFHPAHPAAGPHPGQKPVHKPKPKKKPGKPRPKKKP